MPPFYPVSYDEDGWTCMSSAHNTQNRSGGPAAAGGGTDSSMFRRAGGAWDSSTPPPPPLAKPRINLQQPCAQVQTPAQGDALHGIPKSAPHTSCSHTNVPQEYVATKPFALQSHRVWSHSREKRIRQDFTAEFPSLSPPPCAAQVTCGGWWHPTPPHSVRPCVGAHVSPRGCGWWHSCLLQRCKSAEAWWCSFCWDAGRSLLPAVRRPMYPRTVIGTRSKSCWREVQRGWENWWWHGQATELGLHQLSHLFLFCFGTNKSWAGVENKMFFCDLVFGFSGKNVEYMQAVF